ncbi:LEA type 2 family protein [Pseudomonas sp. nanlin1]|uniref:LEA type 2 family protein n=1 Tax=Pseudomonas sp. nanlin1 TaxID=3040605 RepID=UPI00388E3105
MLNRAHATRILLLLWLASLGGCSSWLTGNFQDPQVRLVRVEVVKARLLQQEFILHFRIDNPNEQSLPIRGLRYRVHLGDTLLADGEASDWFTVPAEGREFYQVPVRTNLWRHAKSIAKLLEHPDRPIPYRLQGELKTGLLFGHDLQLRRSGEIIPGNLLHE